MRRSLNMETEGLLAGGQLNATHRLGSCVPPTLRGGFEFVEAI